MAVTVKIPTQLRAATGGVSEASVEGATGASGSRLAARGGHCS